MQSDMIDGDPLHPIEKQCACISINRKLVNIFSWFLCYVLQESKSNERCTRSWGGKCLSTLSARSKCQSFNDFYETFFFWEQQAVVLYLCKHFVGKYLSWTASSKELMINFRKTNFPSFNLKKCLSSRSCSATFSSRHRTKTI